MFRATCTFPSCGIKFSTLFIVQLREMFSLIFNSQPNHCGNTDFLMIICFLGKLHWVLLILMFLSQIFWTEVGEDPVVSFTNLRWKRHAALLILSDWGQMISHLLKSNFGCPSECKGMIEDSCSQIWTLKFMWMQLWYLSLQQNIPSFILVWILCCWFLDFFFQVFN